jgi:3-oxoacyl-[acyl-carrier protein] reductase
VSGRLEGRVALVTGASRGIGAAVVRAMAAEGAAVAINHLATPAMSELAADLAAELRADGADACAVAADVSSAAGVARMIAEVEARLGPVDVLVANAAATERRAWNEIDEAAWDRLMAVNLKGAWLCARAVYPGMRAAGGGSIVTLSSVTVELGAADALHYVTTKAGLIGFTRSLARAVGGDGVRVNCIMPGAIRTEQELELFADQEALAQRMSEVQCLLRRGVPEDIAGAAVFLASSESSFVTGQVLTVDGGWTHR